MFPHDNCLTFYYQNARGLRTKTDAFYRNVLMHSYDVVSICESWLPENIPDNELFDERYLVFRRDRDYAKTGQTLGGGVMIAVRREIAVTPRPEWHSNAEDIWLTLSLRSKNHEMKKLNICTVYIINNNIGSSVNAQLSTFTNNLYDITTQNSDQSFIVLGDFNQSNIYWSKNCDSNELQPFNISGDSQRNFIDTLESCFLTQYNHVANSSSRILDLILCDFPVEVFPCDSPLTKEDSHHPSLKIVISHFIPQMAEVKPRLKYFYDAADYDSILSELDNVGWKTEIYSRSIDDAVDFFYQTLYNLRRQFVPSKLVTSSKFPPWYNKCLIKILKEKSKFAKKHRIYNNISDLQTYLLLKTRAIEIEKECYNNYVAKAEASISINPKAFWSYVKLKSKNSSIPASMSYEGNTANSTEQICSLFSEYFHSTFLNQILNNSNDVVGGDVSVESFQSLNFIEVSEEKVLKLLKTLDISVSAGPDDIPPLFITRCASSLVQPVVMLFRRSLSEGVVPKLWKAAFVTPIHKKGDKSKVEHYRPISKLCILAKIFEKIVYDQVYSSLQSSFSPCQHGFLKGRSTVSNLLLFNQYLTENMDGGGQVDCIYTDYSKAFDRIDHSLLLRKLLRLGIHGDLFRWVSSYVSRRTQAVVINGFTSSWMEIPSGVPQGSLLGPLLFVIFINDVESCFHHSQLFLFADDMKIALRIDDAHDQLRLQSDLHRLDTYCYANKLDLNVSKCYLISFTRKRCPSLCDYMLKGMRLDRVSQVRDLGVIHDEKLLFDVHIDHIISKANKSMGFLIRMSKNFKILYCAYVYS